MTITDESLRRILDDKLDPMKSDLSNIKTSMHGADGRGGVVADVQSNKDKVAEHQLLLRGPGGHDGIVADSVVCKRIFKTLGTGGILGAIAKIYHEVFLKS